MLSLEYIRKDLRDIKYYCSRKDFFEEVGNTAGVNLIIAKIKIYNRVACIAPPRLYDIYASLYLYNNTQESLSDKLGYTIEYISKLNKALIKFFQTNIDESEMNSLL